MSESPEKPSRISPSAKRWLMRGGVLLLALAIGAALGYAFHRPLASWTGAPAYGEPSAAAETGAGGRKVKYWRAPMDPSYISDKPGKSPMGMDLVPVYEDEGGAKGAGIRIDPAVVQNIGVRTGKVTSGPLVRDLRTIARLDYDERTLGVVTLKFGGWVEERFVDYTGAEVKRGDPLFRVYAPELISAQEEYLIALRAARQQASADPRRNKELYDLLLSSRQKLSYWDIPEDQVKQLERTGKVQRTLLIRSPFTGVVTHMQAVPGQHFPAGAPLYRIADLSTIWAYVTVYEQELPWVHVGQQATLSLPYVPGRAYQGRVSYVYPYVSPKARDVKVRLEFENPGLKLKPDMYGDATIHARLAERATLVPDEAVLDTGTRSLVFLALGHGRFDAAEITPGVLAEGGLREVVRGLHSGQEVVLSGQFLIDSESRLREAIEKLEGAKSKSSADHTNHEAKTPPAKSPPTKTPPTKTPPTKTPPPAQPKHPLPAGVVSPLLDAYLKAQGALVQDRQPAPDAVQRLRQAAEALVPAAGALPPGVKAAVQDRAGQLGEAIDALAQAKDISGARDAWKRVGLQVRELLRAHRPPKLRKLYLYWCPMSAAGWLQDRPKARNPYLGPKMPGCGRLEGTLP